MIWRRLFCCLGWHRWLEFPPAARDGPGIYGRRTCRCCGLWEVHVLDDSGVSMSHWVPF